MYRLGDATFDAADPAARELLAAAHAAKKRPLCLCIEPAPTMYLAKVGDTFFVKRLPDSGGSHAPDCLHYEPPAALSGLGDLLGHAITENPDDGITTLKLAFSLSKLPSRKSPTPATSPAETATTDGKRLSLRGLLHWLWDEAEFTRWHPRMAGRRHWGMVRKWILIAAQHAQAKGHAVPELLFMPEAFDQAAYPAIKARRIAQLAPIAASGSGARKLMIVIGEVKEIGPARYGHKIVVKHMPDFHFMLADDIHTRLVRRFEGELGLWNAIDRARLILIGTFSMTASGFATLEEAALMVVTHTWIPVDDAFEVQLVDRLQAEERIFVKALRFNLSADRAVATAILADTRPQPTALFVARPNLAEDARAHLDQLIADAGGPTWLWDVGMGDMMPLPPRPAPRENREMPP